LEPRLPGKEKGKLMNSSAWEEREGGKNCDLSVVKGEEETLLLSFG